MTAKSLLLASTAFVACLTALPSANAQDAERIQLAQSTAPGKDEKQEPGKPAPHQHPAQPQRPQAPPPHQQPAQVPPPAPPSVQHPVQPVPPAPSQREQRPVQAPQPPRHERPAGVPPQQRPAQPTPPTPAPQGQQAPQGPVPPTAAPQQKPSQQTPPPAAQQPAQPRRGAPATSPQQQQPPQSAPISTPGAAPPPPQQPRDAKQFIRQPGQAPTRTIEDLRHERQRVQQGNTTIIREGDRTIVREGDRTIIRHEEADRFAVGARGVHSERRGNQTVTTIVRPNGDQIVTILDANGRLLRRVRRQPNGREIVIIDEGFAGPRRDDFYLAAPPPRLTLPPDRYYVDLDRAPRERIYETLVAPPFERFEGRYTMGQVRYNAPVRMLMPRIDLDINFDTGSWSLTPDQIGKLSVIADAMNRAISRDPREVFLIEGHTDAVGTPEDNLSLSDRRAEAVAVALSEQFGVPPENMVTQGYGEQELKVPTGAAERANRRVAVRRITPLLDGYTAR